MGVYHVPLSSAQRSAWETYAIWNQFSSDDVSAERGSQSIPWGECEERETRADCLHIDFIHLISHRLSNMSTINLIELEMWQNPLSHCGEKWKFEKWWSVFRLRIETGRLKTTWAERWTKGWEKWWRTNCQQFGINISYTSGCLRPSACREPPEHRHRQTSLSLCLNSSTLISSIHECIKLGTHQDDLLHFCLPTTTIPSLRLLGIVLFFRASRVFPHVYTEEFWDGAQTLVWLEISVASFWLCSSRLASPKTTCASISLLRCLQMLLFLPRGVNIVNTWLGSYVSDSKQLQRSWVVAGGPRQNMFMWSNLHVGLTWDEVKTAFVFLWKIQPGGRWITQTEKLK